MLSFWAAATVMTLMVAGVLVQAVVRGRDRAPGSRAASDVEVYRAQIDEIERDVARGVIDPADAERVHAEIARRLLSADKALAQEKAASGRAPVVAALALIVLGVVGSVGAYWWIGAPGYGDMALKDRIAYAEELRQSRPDQAAAEASLPDAALPGNIEPRYAELMERLRETVSERPDDLQGHVLLAQQERRLGNYRAAKEAQGEVLRLKADAVTAEDLASFGELQVLAAGGYVSPEAEMSLRAALVQDRKNGTARYYLGLMLLQSGRPDQAFRIWDALLRAGPENAPWIAPILTQIEELARLAGVRYSIPAIGGGTAPGPSAEQVADAENMTPAERMEMIGSMVAGLSDRLATEGGPATDWARLIASLGVLGERQRAAAIHANAVEVFATDAGALDLINEAGRRAGVID